MSERPRVFVARRIPDEGLDPVAAACEMDLWEDDLPPPREELLRRIAGCDGVLTLLTDRVDDAFLDAAGPGLRVVSNYAVGFDNIDVAACAARGVAVGNTPGVLTETTADLAWALLMAAATTAPRGRPLRPRRPLEDVGSAAAARPRRLRGDSRDRRLRADRPGAGTTGARASGCGSCTTTSRSCRPRSTGPLGATYLPLEGLLAESDFVSLHVNLSPVTRHLINRKSLGWMKSSAVLVNTSRGPVVDQAALAEALRDGVIWAAALDVTDPEPISMDDPLVGLDNCLIVPHIASASRTTRGKMAAMAAANLLAGVRGEPLPTPVTAPGP